MNLHPSICPPPEHIKSRFGLRYNWVYGRASDIPVCCVAAFCLEQILTPGRGLEQDWWDRFRGFTYRPCAIHRALFDTRYPK